MLRAYLEPVRVGQAVRHALVGNDAVSQLGLLSKIGGHRVGVRLAGASSPGRKGCFGIVTEVDPPGHRGCCRVTAIGDVDGFKDLIPGNLYFLGCDPGSISTVAPTAYGEIVQEVGTAISPTILYVEATGARMVI